MTIALPTRAFLEIKTDSGLWNIPKKYREAIDPYIGSLPTSFFIPWPVALLPREGQEVRIYELINDPEKDRLVVESIDYEYSQKDGYIAYITLSDAFSEPGRFDLDCLICLSQEGFLVENQKKTIKEILDEAGLRSTRED